MPLVLVLIFSAVNFKKRDSVLAGITVVVTGVGPVDNETTIDPNLSEPSDTETKFPFSNFSTSTKKWRVSTSTVFLEKPRVVVNKLETNLMLLLLLLQLPWSQLQLLLWVLLCTSSFVVWFLICIHNMDTRDLPIWWRFHISDIVFVRKHIFQYRLAFEPCI